MKRTKVVHAVLALLLVALLPLEQARCACPPTGGMAKAMAQSPACAKSCCAMHTAGQGAGHGATLPTPAQSPSSKGDCPCMHPTAPEVPAAVAVPAPGPEVPLGAVTATPRFAAPVATVLATAPAPDIGSPPLRVDPGAHGLRAPPVSA